MKNTGNFKGGGGFAMTDEEKDRLGVLIRAVANGNSQCLDKIFAIAGKKMFAVAYSVVGNRDGAEDVVSESFLKLARFAGRFRRDDDPSSWIMKIVKNTALDYVRKRKRLAEADGENLYFIPDESYSPEKRETAILIESAMKRLSPDQRQAIYLRYYLDLTVREVGAAMNLARSTAERLIKNAEENLKKY